MKKRNKEKEKKRSLFFPTAEDNSQSDGYS